MSNSIAVEAQQIVRRAAEPVRPGATVKEQQNVAARALGYPAGHWRVRAAWKGEAGSWSAVAFQDLKDRYDAWAATQERRKDADKRRLASLYAALAERLADNQNYRREDIAQLVNAARSLGHVARR